MKHIVIDARVRRSSTGRYHDRLVTHLQNIDHENRYTVLIQPDDTWPMQASNFTTVPCPFPQFSLNPLNELRFAWQLYQLKPDLVHFCMTQQPLLYFGNIVTTTHDLTMFYFVRRGNTNPIVHWLKMRLYHFLMWWSHKKSRTIIVPTKTVAKELAIMQPFTAKKTVVTYESAGLPLEGDSIQPKGISGDFIMYLGTAFPHKNLPILLDAFDLLHATRPDLTLVFVGKQEKHYIELEAWAKDHPSHAKIIFTGFLPDEQAKWLYRNCRVFVTPSLAEGWGLPGLEAMTNGAPVVSSNASCLPEVYGDAAHYCNPKDPHDIAAKIGEVLDNTSLRKTLLANAQKQIKKYSWTKMAQETYDLYSKNLS